MKHIALIEENKNRQEAILRAEQEKTERKQNKKMMEERWAMARWISSYIDENTDRWKREKNMRKDDEKTRAESWKKMERLEKIRMIKEKLEENKIVTINMRPAKFPSPEDVPQSVPGDDHPQSTC